MRRAAELRASGVPSVRSSFDEQDQLDKVGVCLLEGETVIAVDDGGDTGFIGLTDEIRLSHQDKARHVHEVVLRSMGGFGG